MITADQASKLQPGDVLIIDDHFKYEHLNAREFVFSEFSPSAGYVRGRLIIRENEADQLGEEVTFRLNEVRIKPQLWNDFCLKIRVENIVESLLRQKDNAENEAILHRNEKDQAQYLSKKNESLTLQVVITALKSALEARE